MEPEAFKTVGKVARRKDGLAKVTGVEVYASDVELPYMFHARVLRSPHAHARIVSIDTSAAEKMGAVCLTPDDVPDIRYNERQVSVPVKTFRDRTVLPRVVRQVGEGVVAVAAQTEALAERALRHRHQEWLKFLRVIETQTPAGVDIHVILDNYATHKHPKVTAWLNRHPRFHLHFTPTSASWLNLVERFFRDLSQDVVLPGSFASVDQLTQAIWNYLAERNLRPARYEWKADGKVILAKIERARAALASPSLIK